MAGLLLHVNSGEVALTANTARSVLQLRAPANQRLILRGIKVLGKQPAGGTDTPVRVRLTRSTANFGKANPSNGETIQSTAAAAFTVEPTTPADGGLMWEVQPQSGVIEFLPPGLEVHVPGGQAISFEATSPGTPTILITATYEE
jgi:hypothetical protein